MFSSRTNSRLVILLIVATVLGAVASFWYLATQGDDIAFLAEHGGARWIVYPVPVNLQRRLAVRLDTVFRRRFTLDAVPGQTGLLVRGHRSVQVVVNGQLVLPEVGAPSEVASWRDEHRVPDISPHLKAGDNEIVVTVWNDGGPPALWLLLAGHDWSVVSDEQWEASYVGAAWRAARLAAAPPRHHMADATGDPAGPQMPTAVESLRRQWPVVAVIAGVAAAMVAVAAAARRKWGGNIETEAFLLSGRCLYVLVAAVIVIWVVLFTHNLDLLPSAVGFDIDGHVQYIKIILDEGRLPLAEDGWQAYQPPLFYLLAAAVLKVGGLTVGSSAAGHAIRTLTMVFGIAQVLLVFGCVRQLFPDNPRRQLLGLVVAATLPVHLYLYHYVTNEGLAATMITASLYVMLRILNRPNASFQWYIGLGACLGGAMLSKFSAVVILPVVFTVLAGRLVLARERRPAAWGQTVGLVVAACVLVCGWHFIRVWIHYGRPIVGNWDAEAGARWWQDAGYHTAGYYVSFGRALVQPLYAGLYGFADAMYSTFWGDGFAGGSTSVRYSSPWNWEVMSAGYLLALVPVIGGLVGLGAAVVRLVRRPTAAWMLVLGCAAITLAALIYITMKLPFYGQAKAFYGMGAVVAIVACIAWGLDLLAGRRLGSKALIWTLVLTVCGCGLVAFWIPANSVQTERVNGTMLAGTGNFAEGLSHAETAVRLSPHDPDALLDCGRILASSGKITQAETHYCQALEIEPNFAECRLNLGLLLMNGKGDQEGALEQLRLATEADPDHSQAWAYRTGLLIKAKRIPEAIDALREALRVTPHDPTLHRQMAALLNAVGRKDEARRHADYAQRLARELVRKGRNP